MKILVPVDFHKTSFSAYRYAMNLADMLSAEITLLHIINGSFGANDAIVFTPLSTVEDVARKRLQYFASEYADEMNIDLPDVKVHLEVSFGLPGFTAAEYADRNDFDLIIMGTRDRHGIFDRMLGSASAIAIREAQCPVILIHKTTVFNTPKKIAFAFDSKSDLEGPLETFKDLNKKIGAKTDFVHVRTNQDEDISDQEEEIVEEMLKEEEYSFSFEVLAIEGKKVRPALKDYCLFNKMDMLAMVHRKTGIFSAVFRSHQSVKLAQEYHLPVIVFQET